MCALFLSEAYAQRKSVGSSFSYAGIGLLYEHELDDKSFAEIQLRAETSALYADRRNGTGFTASFSWNMVFSEKQVRNGNRIVFFAGPGIMAGITGDVKNGNGLMIGLKGRVGGECTFRRKVAVSLSVSPVIGLHMGAREGMINMLLYRTGLLYTIMPEVGLKYAF